MEFSFATTPSFLQDNFFAASLIPNVDINNPYTAPHPNLLGLYLPRRAQDDRYMDQIMEAVVISGDGSTADLLEFGRARRRMLQVRYSGSERAGGYTERYFVEEFYRDHLRGGATLRYHPAGETLSAFDDLTEPEGYHQVIRIGPAEREREFLVPGWYEHIVENWEFLELP